MAVDKKRSVPSAIQIRTSREGFRSLTASERDAALAAFRKGAELYVQGSRQPQRRRARD